jgi:hypothetical protein
MVGLKAGSFDGNGREASFGFASAGFLDGSIPDVKLHIHTDRMTGKPPTFSMKKFLEAFHTLFPRLN